MLYNIKKKKIHTNTDCFTCEYYNAYEQKCEGIGKMCFEQDEKTGLLIDPKTKKSFNKGDLK